MDSVNAMAYGLMCTSRPSSVNLVVRDRNSVSGSTGGAYVIQRILDASELMDQGVGAVVARDLKPDELLKVDIACLLAMTVDVMYDFQLYGDGDSQPFCLATVSGPGTVWLQSTSYKNSKNS